MISFAQNVQIKGVVMATDLSPLVGATIEFGDGNGAISDLEGKFVFEYSDNEPIRLIVKYIGYESIDTTIQVRGQSNIFLELVMYQDLVELSEIEVSAKYQNIFENYKSHINDFVIADSTFYLLVDKGRGTFLALANLNGTIEKEVELESKYSKFFTSCLGSLIVIGDDQCAEIRHQNDKVFLTNHFSIEFFEQYLIPCKMKQKDALLVKKISRHNKRIEYYKSAVNGAQSLLYVVYDKVGDKVSQGYYNQVIGAYRASLTGEPEEEDIDYGIRRDVFMGDRFQEKELLDYVVSNDSHKYVAQYRALGLKAVRSNLFVLGEDTYILDELNKKIVLLDLDHNTYTEVGSSEPLEGVDFFVSDLESLTYVQKGDYLLKVEIEDGQFVLTNKRKLKRLYFDYSYQLYGNILYRLGRASVGSVKKIFTKDRLE